MAFDGDDLEALAAAAAAGGGGGGGGGGMDAAMLEELIAAEEGVGNLLVTLDRVEAADAVEEGLAGAVRLLDAGELAAAMREVWDGVDLLEVVHFLTLFLDDSSLQPRHDGVWRPVAAAAGGGGASLCDELERRYYEVAGDRLRHTLGAARVALAGVGDGGVALMYRGRQLDRDGVAALRADLMLPFAPGSAVDFGSTVALTLRACAAVLEEHVGGDVPGLAEGLAELRVAPNSVSGEPFMVPFEACFQTDAANRVVSVPDPDELTEAHRELMMERHRSATVADLHADFFLVCLIAPCHEILHAVQHLAGQQDPDPQSWSAEHDASYACLSLFWAASAHPIFDAVLPPGFRELAAAHELRRAAKRAARLGPADRDAYRAWRRSFGADGPPPQDDAPPYLEGDFKSVLAVEAFSRAHLAEQLGALFRGRTGDVQLHRLDLPACLTSGAGGLPADSPGLLVEE